ncbi:MAG: hypothetical protein CMJ70_07785 [Planctomycetaceae bacterium]|nr:hypothetical protein [Planctomycetaceae bacterium]
MPDNANCAPGQPFLWCRDEANPGRRVLAMPADGILSVVLVVPGRHYGFLFSLVTETEHCRHISITISEVSVYRRWMVW